MNRDCILILTPGFPATEDDSTCLPPIQQFCLCLKEEFPHLRVVIVSMQYPFKHQVYFWNGYEVHAAGGANRRRSLRLFTWLRTWRILKKVRRECKPVAILSLWLGETALIGKWFARLHDMRHLIWLQGQDAKKENRYVSRVRPDPSSLIAISSFNANELLKHHQLKVSAIIPNGVNVLSFPDFNTGNRDIDVLGVGALIPLKNYSAFVHTVYGLKKQHPDIKAILAGDGPDSRSLQTQIITLGLERNLKLVGSVQHKEILELMSRSRIFIHPSRYEGHSTVLLEALYSGCATISTQPVADGQTDNFFLCQNEQQILDVAIHLYAQTDAKKVLVNDMRLSARQMVNRLLGE